MQINYVLNYLLFASFTSCISLWSSKSNFSKWLFQKTNLEGNVKIKIQTNLQIKEAADPMRTAPWGRWWGHANLKMKVVATDLPRVHLLNTSCRKSLFLQYTQNYFSNVALAIINTSNGKVWPSVCQVLTVHLISAALCVLGHGFLFMNRESRKMSSQEM